MKRLIAWIIIIIAAIYIWLMERFGFEYPDIYPGEDVE